MVKHQKKRTREESDEDAAANLAKYRMMSTEDREDILLANTYRLSLSKPPQSFFRVIALLFYEEGEEKSDKASRLPPWVSQRTKDGRTYIVGSNDEPGYMGGSICAERSAIVQLRFLPSARVTKLVICTDSTEPIAPGMLCREFMAGHPSFPWDLRIITAASKCIKCGKNNHELFKDDGIPNECVDGIPMLDLTLKDLYPYPSPYTRLDSSQSVALGESFAKSQKSRSLIESLTKGKNSSDRWKESDGWKDLMERALEEAKKNSTEQHPIQFGAAVKFTNGEIVTSRQVSALEYGCSLDAISLLGPQFDERMPRYMVQVDQYGVAHAPFAPARAFLNEKAHGYGFGNCQILVHTVPMEKDPTDLDTWSLTVISASELTPNAPHWASSTER